MSVICPYCLHEAPDPGENGSFCPACRRTFAVPFTPQVSLPFDWRGAAFVVAVIGGAIALLTLVAGLLAANRREAAWAILFVGGGLGVLLSTIVLQLRDIADLLAMDKPVEKSAAAPKSQAWRDPVEEQPAQPLR